MINEEMIKCLPLKAFADLLIKTVTCPEYDEDYNGDTVYCGDWTYYKTSDGQEFDGYEDALQHECWWLAQEANEDWSVLHTIPSLNL